MFGDDALSYDQIVPLSLIGIHKVVTTFEISDYYNPAFLG